jgi:DNA-binding beta-propeller fold protein YncE
VFGLPTQFRRPSCPHAIRLLSIAGILLTMLVVVAGCTQQQKVPTSTGTKRYTLWPAAPDEPRVQFLTAYSTSEDIAPPRGKFDEMLYGKSTGLGIVKPYGIAFHNGCIYVTDLRSPGIIVLDLRNKQTRIIGTSGSADVQKAIAIAIAADGTKFVIDSARNAIVVFDPQDRYLTTYAPRDFNPVDLAVYQNELYVSDFNASVVKVLDVNTGTQLRTIGKPGPNDGEFVRPLSIRIDLDGNVLVADVFKCRIQKFTRDGKLLMAFGQAGNRAGDFVRPKHMAVDNKGMIYVVDAAFNNVQVFDPQGKVVGFFGSRGTFPGSMDLPAGLCITTADMDLFGAYVHPAFQVNQIVLVSNQFGPAKISVYAEGQLKPGKTVADLNATRLAIAEAPPSTQPTSRPISIGVPLPPELFESSTQPAVAPPSHR